MSLARKRVYSAQRVVTAPYFADGLGHMRPRRPQSCALAVPGVACTITWHGRRPRKCGPGFPFALCLCDAHDITFTVYPPSWLPFGRRPVVDVAASGHDVIVDSTAAAAWTNTAFGASADAAARVLWPLSYAGFAAWRAQHGRDPYGVSRTQKRHVAGVNVLLALTPNLESERATVVAALGIDLAALVVAAGRVRDGPGLVAEGEKGAAILSALGRPSRRLLPGINRLGVDREYWGPPVPIQS